MKATIEIRTENGSVKLPEHGMEQLVKIDDFDGGDQVLSEVAARLDENHLQVSFPMPRTIIDGMKADGEREAYKQAFVNLCNRYDQVYKFMRGTVALAYIARATEPFDQYEEILFVDSSMDESTSSRMMVMSSAFGNWHDVGRWLAIGWPFGEYNGMAGSMGDACGEGIQLMSDGGIEGYNTHVHYDVAKPDATGDIPGGGGGDFDGGTDAAADSPDRQMTGGLAQTGDPMKPPFAAILAFSAFFLFSVVFAARRSW